MQRWPATQVDFRGLFDNGDLLLWSGVQRAYPRWVHFCAKTRMGLPLICSIFFLSLWSLFISLWSPPNNTPHPLPSVYLSFKKSLQPEFSFFHFMTWLLGPLLLCESVSCDHSLPPSFLLRPYINTGSDFSLRVYNVFLQLYQERCVNGYVAGWVAGLVF